MYGTLFVNPAQKITFEATTWASQEEDKYVWRAQH